MLIQKIIGGLGNQLNEYAYAYSVAKYLGQELILDLSDYCSNGYFRPYCLDKLSIPPHKKITYPFVTPQVCTTNCIPLTLKKDFLVVEQEKEIFTREDLLRKIHGAENVYLVGYGGLDYCDPTEKAEILSMFQLKEPSPAVEQFKQKIQGEHSVAVHVRRTDFVGLQCANSESYYQAAIAYIRLFYPDAQFYFFSDDMNFVKTAFGNHQNYHYVHLLGGMDADMEEFFCISACTDRILSSKSSFSYWASVLQQDRGKLDICYGARDDPACISDWVYLNASAVERLSQKCYETLPPSLDGYAYSETVNNLYTCLEENKNDAVISAVDEMSLDSFPLDTKQTRELMTLKAIAHAQKGEKSALVAVESFYRQMQTACDDPLFHHNFFLALLQAGQTLKAAIHAARAEQLAMKTGENIHFESYFQEHEKALELYHLLRNTPKRHFVFVPMESWSFFINYNKTLAVLLARMGHKVSYINEMLDATQWGVDDAHITQTLLQRHWAADSVYHYHVALFRCAYCKKGSTRKFYYEEMIQGFADKEKLKTVAVISSPQAVPNKKSENILYFVPDMGSVNNIERHYFKDDLFSYYRHMGQHVDGIFLSDPARKKQLEKQVQSKLYLIPDKNWPRCGYETIDEEVDFTSNYMDSNDIILAAAELIRASNQRFGDFHR